MWREGESRILRLFGSNRRLQLEGKPILVTGAARGLGKQLALRLAGVEKADLVLVDQNGGALRATAREVEETSSSRVAVVELDLLKKDCAPELAARVEGMEIFGLINNAGLTFYGETRAAHMDRQRAIIDLDFRVVVELSLLFLRRFQRQGAGFILNVTSLGAFAPVPYQAVYGASKSAVQLFTECLYAENRYRSIVISTFAPSGIITEMIKESGLTRHMEKHLYSYVTPEQAAETVVRGLKKGKRLIIPGVINKLLYLLMSFLPRGILIALTARIFRHEKYREADTPQG